MHYALSVHGLATGTTAGTFKTLLGFKHADTTGHRARVRALHVSGGNGAPQDLQATIKMALTDNTTDGTSTDASSDVAKKDGDSVASRMTAVGKNYTVEPTAYGDPVFLGALNTRGQLHKEWHDPDSMPVWGKNTTLGVLATIGDGTTAANLDVTIEWEEF